MVTSCVQLVRGFVLLHTMIGCFVQAKFDFTVHFYEYWNPTGLCGECGIDGIPACCDDTTLTDNCSNIGVKRCDTRFRFILRPYGASVKTAPSDNYEYYTRSVTNEIHDTFKQGSGGFLSLPNPHTSYNTTAWTGRIQLHIDAIDRAQNISEMMAIIDRFPIDLELDLGANFTQRASYFGVYNVSQLDMSFKVKCSKNYYGPDCTKLCEPVEMYSCDSDGDRICSSANYDISTDCTTCLPGRDISTNCTKCLSGYVGKNCITATATATAAATAAVASVTDIVLGVFLILSIAIIIALIIVMIIMRKSPKQSIKQEGTSTHDEGYAATNKPPGKPLEEAFVDDTKV